MKEPLGLYDSLRLEDAEKRLKAAYDQYWSAQTPAEERDALQRIERLKTIIGRFVPHYAGITG
jgi:hypothetical protein